MEKKLTMKELDELIAKHIEAQSEKILEQIKSMLVASPSGKKETRAEKVAKVFKAIFSGDSETIKALGVGVNGGQYLLPEEFVNMVVEKAPIYSVFRKVAFVYPARRLTGSVPIEADEGSVYWTGSLETVQDANLKLSQIKYTLNKLMAKLPVDNDILEYTDVDLVNYLSNAFAKAITKAEDKAFTNGTGDGQPEGIRTVADIPALTVGIADFKLDNVSELKNKLPIEYHPTAVFMTSQRGLELLEKMKDANGRPLLSVYENGTMKLFGKDVIVNPYIPSNLGTGGNGTELWFGDFQKYFIFDGKQIEMKVFEHQDIDAQIIRVKYLVDGKVAVPEAFVKLVIS